MMHLFYACTLVFFLFFQLNAQQWNPDAGVIPPISKNAVLTSSSGGNTANAIDGNRNTAWQSGGGSLAALPTGYITRSDLNILLGLGLTSQCTRSGTASPANTTDGNMNSSVTIQPVNGTAWITYDLINPIQLRTISVKCNVGAAPVHLYAHHSNGDSTLIETMLNLGGQNFNVRKFSPLLNDVVKIKLISTTGINLFEVAAMAKLPTEYLIVDLQQIREVGYIETRHWCNGEAEKAAIYLSLDGVNWILADTLDPEAFLYVVTRPPTPVDARYVKIEFSLKEVDYSKAYVWEISVYDKFGPYGPFPTAKPHNLNVKEVMGVNGLWGWGQNVTTSNIPAGYGPDRFNKIGNHGRNYHDLHWDLKNMNDTADYTGHWGLAIWWLNWNHEYGAWRNKGLKVQASIQFSNYSSVTSMANWNNHYQTAYNYGYNFARHFGPTYGNNLVDVMEIGNEPWNYPAWFYLDIFRGMLHGAKAADPAMKVIPCALQSQSKSSESATGGNFMGARVTQSEANLIDGINVHHYSYTFNKQGVRIAVNPEHPESAMRGAVNDVRFRDANMPGKKIYLSEWGWDSDGAGDNCTFGECVSEYEQALYAVRGAMMFMRLGMHRITWYFFGNLGSGNLYSRSGLEGQKPDMLEKRAMSSFQAFTHLMGDKHFLNVLHEDDDAWVYLFGDSIGTPTHIAAWRPIKGDDLSSIPFSLSTVLSPDTAWIVSGANKTGELTPLHGYNNGVMNMTLTSAPLIMRVTPVEATTHVWNGNFSDDWDSPLNWDTYLVPAETDTAIIPGGRPHYPANYLGTVTVNELILEAGSQMTLEPGVDLIINQDLQIQGGTLIVTTTAGVSSDIYVQGNLIQTAGAFVPSTGKVILNGNTPQTITGNFDFHHLETNNQNTVEIFNTVNASGIVSVMTGSTLITNNNLTLQSGGSLMHGPDTPGGQNGDVTGTVRVRRQGSNHALVYNYWSSPVVSSNASVLGSSTYYYNPSNADDTTETGLRKGWVSATGIMQQGLGYISKSSGLVTFTGIPNSASIANPVSLNIRKNVGNQNEVAFNLIGNPFPSGMDAQKFMDVNGPLGSGAITGAMYFWDDDRSGGANWNANEDYVVWSGAGVVAGPNSGTPFTGHVASCQSFFVEKMDNGSSPIHFNNSMRSTENNAFFRLAPIERLWVNLVNPDNVYNETLIAFMDEATDDIDWVYDARKLQGNEKISFYSMINGRQFAIQALGPLSTEKTVPLGFKTNIAGNHTIRLKEIENMDESVAVVLEDKVTGTFTHLRISPQYTFHTPAGTFNQRFVLHFSLPVQLQTQKQLCNENSGSITFTNPGNWLWDYTLTDDAGTIIDAATDFTGTIHWQVAGGNYALQLTDDFGYTITKSVTVQAEQTVLAAFSVAHENQVIKQGEQLVFSDHSTGGDFNEWQFGDGTTMTNINQPQHSYLNPGVYEVVLHSWNPDCEDYYHEEILVHEKTDEEIINSVSAIQTTVAENDRFVVFSENQALYIRFDFSKQTDAQIFIHDLTGRLIHRQQMVTSGIQQIDLPPLANAVYFARVITNDKALTEKVVTGN